MYLCAEGRKCRTQETGRESALTFITGNLQRRQKTESGESWTRKHKTKGYTAGIWGITQQWIQINKGRNSWNEYTWWHKGGQIECHAHRTRDYHNKTGKYNTQTWHRHHSGQDTERQGLTWEHRKAGIQCDTNTEPMTQDLWQTKNSKLESPQQQHRHI